MAVSNKAANNKRTFQKSKPQQVFGSKTKSEIDSKEDVKPVNKRIVFGDEGKETPAVDPVVKNNKNKSKKQVGSDIGLKWYEEVNPGSLIGTDLRTKMLMVCFFVVVRQIQYGRRAAGH